MPVKKSELYSSLWKGCDELRGGMDASQYKDYVLVLLFMKYVSDKYAGQRDPLIDVPAGGGFADMVALKGDKEIGDKLNKIIARLAEANDLRGVIDVADFNDADKLGKGKEMVDRLSNLVSIFDNPALDFDEVIVSTVRRQLTWSHLKTLIYLKDPLQRDFYEVCRLERWSSRQLAERIGSMLFERTAISKRPDETIAHDLAALREEQAVSPELLLKEPYVLDFLGLKDRYLEKDLEDAILRELELFLLELGAGFTFVARQKRLEIDHDDFYIDLLLYNRKLRRLVAVELKLGDFKPDYKGQMELYLRWLAKYEQEPGEAPPLGIILCAGKKSEQIELCPDGVTLIGIWPADRDARRSCGGLRGAPGSQKTS